MMALDLARALDPTLIASDCGITLDKWQAELMRSTAPRILLLCARQTGKTTTTGFIALDTAIYKPGSLTLILSPSQRQSAEMQRTIMSFHSKLQGAPALNSESVLKSEFSNGSRIIALPGTEKTIRGYAAADLIIIDEASRVEDELLAAVRPMLATSAGKLIALTTPAGKRGWFFESWTTGGDDWHRVRVPASDCPRITQEFLAEELRELGAMRFSEEYGLEFRDNLEAAFPQTIIEAAFSQEVTPLWA
jgi:Terminase large subunit, T4likevirus-type, N-terminal